MDIENVALDAAEVQRRRAGAGDVKDADNGEVLMLAWMNAESLRQTLAGGRMVYWSRSRNELWRKGDTSGDVQVVREAYYDCDGDTLLFKVDQHGGGACHTGAHVLLPPARRRSR